MQSSTGIESSAFSDSKPGNKSGNNPDDDSNGKSGGGPDGKRENHGLQAMTQRSQLFAGLMERFEDNQSLSILDVGPGVAESVDFFAGRRCRLYFADLFDRLPLAQLVDDLSGNAGSQERQDREIAEVQRQIQLQRDFEQALPPPDSGRVDLVLFWDLFEYLDAGALTALSMALQPLLHSGSRGHGFVQRDRQKTAKNYRYGISSAENFTAKPGDRQGLPKYCHTQASVERQLQGLTIHRGVLMVDGRLELLLQPA